jgi:hypothetical protein
MAWHGMAWHGMAWHGMAWHTMAWHGHRPGQMHPGPVFVVLLLQSYPIERAAKSSGLPWTIIRLPFFLDNIWWVGSGCFGQVGGATEAGL